MGLKQPGQTPPHQREMRSWSPYPPDECAKASPRNPYKSHCTQARIPFNFAAVENNTSRCRTQYSGLIHVAPISAPLFTALIV